MEEEQPKTFQEWVDINPRVTVKYLVDNLYEKSDYANGIVDLMLSLREAKMENLELKKEQEKDNEVNVIDFPKPKLASSSDGTSFNWLADMDEGTLLLVRDNQEKRNFALPCFQLVKKLEKTAALVVNAVGPDMATWVDTRMFSSRFNLVANLGSVKRMEDVSEQTNTT